MTKKKPEDEELTSQEAADVLTRKENTIRRWRTTGKGPAFSKIGGKITYTRKDIEAWKEKERKKNARKKHR